MTKTMLEKQVELLLDKSLHHHSDKRQGEALELLCNHNKETNSILLKKANDGS